jgi:hypothetical protein
VGAQNWYRRGRITGGLGQVFQHSDGLGNVSEPIRGARLLPFSGKTFMHLVGVIEVIAGLAILTRWTRIGAYAASVWLVLIALNLVASLTFFDLAVRDVEIAIAAYVLAKMTEVKQHSTTATTPRLI